MDGNPIVYVVVALAAAVLIVGGAYVYHSGSGSDLPTVTITMDAWDSLEPGAEVDEVLGQLPEPTGRIENGPMLMVEYRTTADQIMVLYFEDGYLLRRDPE